jgi:hypothetical protein
MTEWLKLMLQEIARKQAERENGLTEAARRAEERAAIRAEDSAAPPRRAKNSRTPAS